MIATKAPLHIQMLETSYLIFFYHLPSALLLSLFLVFNAAFSVVYLATQNPDHDLRAKVFGEIGLLCSVITLATGSCWARMAWGQWWSFTDVRLLSAAVLCLSYTGYVVLQNVMEPGDRRRRYAAVFAIIAVINVPMVKYAIKWFGEGQHPMGVTSSDDGLKLTKWFGVGAFLVLYLLIYRWKIARERVRASIDSTLSEARQIEEGRLT